MGSPLIKRLDALYQRAQMVMKVQADHAPFVSIAPWSFIKDECIVKYYPEGHYQKPEQITTTLHDAWGLLGEKPSNENYSISGHLIRWRTLSVRNLLKCGLKPEKQESLLEKQKPIQSRNLLSMQRDRAAVMQKCFI